MTLICLKKRYLAIPTTWNELTGRQLRQVMDCLFLRSYTEEQGRLKLLKILAGMSWWRFFRTPASEMAEFLYLTDFLVKERTGLTRQLIPVFRGLYGPADELNNLLMQELAYSDAYYMQWQAKKDDIAALNNLVASLYRPAKKGYDFEKNPDGDPREEFNPNLCEWRARKRIKRWPMAVKLAIAWWYDSCRWQIVEQNDEVFGGTGDASKYGLVSLMLSVAEEGALGTFNEVEKQYVNVVLMKINESIANAKRQEAAIKK